MAVDGAEAAVVIVAVAVDASLTVTAKPARRTSYSGILPDLVSAY